MLWLTFMSAADTALVPQIGHHEAVLSASFSPDGAQVLTTSLDGSAILWDVETGAVLHHLTLGGWGDGAWSADGRSVLTVADESGALWDAATGRARITLSGTAVNRTGALSPDGRLLWTTGAIWDATSGEALRPLDLGFAPRTMAFSPDGKQVLVVPFDAGAAEVRSARTGKVLRALAAADDAGSARFSPDGKHVAALSLDHRLTVWDARGRLQWSEAVLDGYSELLAFSPDGSLVAAVEPNGDVGLRAVADGLLRQHLETGERAFAGAAFSPDGARIVTAAQDSLDEWDTQSGLLLRHLADGAWGKVSYSADGARILASASDHVGWWDAAEHRLDGDAPSLLAASLGADGSRLLTIDEDGALAVWDTTRGAIVARSSHPHDARALAGSVVALGGDDLTVLDWTSGRTILHAAQEPRALALSPDAARLAVATGAAVQVYDLVTGAVLREWALSERVSTLTFSADGAIGGGGTVWDVDTGAVVVERDPKRYPRGVSGVALSPDRSTLAVSWMSYDPPYGRVTLEDLGGGLARELPHRSEVEALVFSADGRRLLTESWNEVTLWDATSGARLWTAVHDDFVESVSFVQGETRVLSASRDGTARLWDAATGALLATLVTFPGGWAVADPAGRFDASDDGHVDGLRWRIDGRPYALDQLRAPFYDPGLLEKVLHRPDALRAVPPLAEIAPPALVRLDGPAPDGKLRLTVEDRGGGVGRIFLRLNGSDVSELVSACAAKCAVDLSTRPTWVPGAENHVAVEVGNGANTVASRGLDASVVAAGAPPSEPPALWVLAVGSSDYAGERLDLRYSAADARRIGQALTLAGAGGFGANATHVRVLSTDPGQPRPTADAVREGLRWLAGAKPQDTVVLFLSGHGLAVTDPALGVDDYFYLLPDAASFDDVRDPLLRDRRALSGEALADALTAVPALKRVIVLDTCAAGKADQPLFAARALSSDAVRAQARARERTGAWLLAGAAADAVSYEATRYGQGVLTWTLLEGMRGPALDPAGELYVSRLFAHAEEGVRANAAGIGGVQVPVLRRGEGDFPIGELSPSARAEIRIPQARSVLVRAAVQGADGRADVRGVGAAVDRRLRELADAPSAHFVMWDADPAPGLWQISGQVTERAGGVLVFSGFLTRFGEPPREIPLQVAGLDPTELATALARVVVPQFPQ